MRNLIVLILSGLIASVAMAGNPKPQCELPTGLCSTGLLDLGGAPSNPCPPGWAVNEPCATNCWEQYQSNMVFSLAKYIVCLEDATTDEERVWCAEARAEREARMRAEYEGCVYGCGCHLIDN